MGHVMDVTDQLLGRPSRRIGPTVCPPDDRSGKAAVEVVRRYAQEGSGAAELVRSGLARVYPCSIERSGR